MSKAKLGAASPNFIVRDVAASIAFYRDALGFEVRYKEPEVGAFFAIVGRDSAQIFVKAERGRRAGAEPHAAQTFAAGCVYLRAGAGCAGGGVCGTGSYVQRSAEGYA